MGNTDSAPTTSALPPALPTTPGGTVIPRTMGAAPLAAGRVSALEAFYREHEPSKEGASAALLEGYPFADVCAALQAKYDALPKGFARALAVEQGHAEEEEEKAPELAVVEGGEGEQSPQLLPSSPAVGSRHDSERGTALGSRSMAPNTPPPPGAKAQAAAAVATARAGAAISPHAAGAGGYATAGCDGPPSDRVRALASEALKVGGTGTDVDGAAAAADVTAMLEEQRIELTLIFNEKLRVLADEHEKELQSEKRAAAVAAAAAQDAADVAHIQAVTRGAGSAAAAAAASAPAAAAPSTAHPDATAAADDPRTAAEACVAPGDLETLQGALRGFYDEHEPSKVPLVPALLNSYSLQALCGALLSKVRAPAHFLCCCSLPAPLRSPAVSCCIPCMTSNLAPHSTVLCRTGGPAAQ